MRERIYAMELSFLSQLLDDRRELFAVARSLGSAEEMRAARTEFMAETRVNVSPKSGEQPEYHVDAQGTAHIPIVGELTSQAKTDICGAYTAEALTEYGFIQAATRAAADNPRVERIRYEIDSPGGYFAGLPETADMIRSVGKPTEARVGSMAASAAYWLASQADRITASSIGSRIGSIGVAVEEYDNTQALKNAGITRRVYTSTDAPDKRPDTSTEEGQAKITAMLDDLHGVFTRYVAEGRGISAETVRSDFGRGGLVMAEEAARRGMIDAVASVPPRETEKQTETSGVAGATEHSRQKAGNSREVPMDRNQLKTEHPDLYTQLEHEFSEAGVKAERERVGALLKQKQHDPENAKLAEVIEQAVAEGTSVAEAQTAITVAVRDGKIEGENPPDVTTASASEDEDDLVAKLAAPLKGVK